MSIASELQRIVTAKNNIIEAVDYLNYWNAYNMNTGDPLTRLDTSNPIQLKDVATLINSFPHYETVSWSQETLSTVNAVSGIKPNINRISVVKSNLRKAIRNKGVDVPTTATLDEYPSYIRQIHVCIPSSIRWTNKVTSTTVGASHTFIAEILEQYRASGDMVIRVLENVVPEILLGNTVVSTTGSYTWSPSATGSYTFTARFKIGNNVILTNSFVVSVANAVTYGNLEVHTVTANDIPASGGTVKASWVFKQMKYVNDVEDEYVYSDTVQGTAITGSNLGTTTTVRTKKGTSAALYSANGKSISVSQDIYQEGNVPTKWVNATADPTSHAFALTAENFDIIIKAKLQYTSGSSTSSYYNLKVASATRTNGTWYTLTNNTSSVRASVTAASNGDSAKTGTITLTGHTSVQTNPTIGALNTVTCTVSVTRIANSIQYYQLSTVTIPYSTESTACAASGGTSGCTIKVKPIYSSGSAGSEITLSAGTGNSNYTLTKSGDGISVSSSNVTWASRGTTYSTSNRTGTVTVTIGSSYKGSRNTTLTSTKTVYQLPNTYTYKNLVVTPAAYTTSETGAPAYGGSSTYTVKCTKEYASTSTESVTLTTSDYTVSAYGTGLTAGNTASTRGTFSWASRGTTTQLTTRSGTINVTATSTYSSLTGNATVYQLANPVAYYGNLTVTGGYTTTNCPASGGTEAIVVKVTPYYQTSASGYTAGSQITLTSSDYTLTKVSGTGMSVSKPNVTWDSRTTSSTSSTRSGTFTVTTTSSYKDNGGNTLSITKTSTQAKNEVSYYNNLTITASNYSSSSSPAPASGGTAYLTVKATPVYESGSSGTAVTITTSNYTATTSSTGLSVSKPNFTWANRTNDGGTARSGSISISLGSSYPAQGGGTLSGSITVYQAANTATYSGMYIELVKSGTNPEPSTYYILYGTEYQYVFPAGGFTGGIKVWITASYSSGAPSGIVEIPSDSYSLTRSGTGLSISKPNFTWANRSTTTGDKRSGTITVTTIASSIYGANTATLTIYQEYNYLYCTGLSVSLDPEGPYSSTTSTSVIPTFTVSKKYKSGSDALSQTISRYSGWINVTAQPSWITIGNYYVITVPARTDGGAQRSGDITFETYAGEYCDDQGRAVSATVSITQEADNNTVLYYKNLTVTPVSWTSSAIPCGASGGNAPYTVTVVPVTGSGDQAAVTLKGSEYTVSSNKTYLLTPQPSNTATNGSFTFIEQDCGLNNERSANIQITTKSPYLNSSNSTLSGSATVYQASNAPIWGTPYLPSQFWTQDNPCSGAESSISVNPLIDITYTAGSSCPTDTEMLTDVILSTSSTGLSVNNTNKTITWSNIGSGTSRSGVVRLTAPSNKGGKYTDITVYQRAVETYYEMKVEADYSSSTNPAPASGATGEYQVYVRQITGSGNTGAWTQIDSRYFSKSATNSLYINGGSFDIDSLGTTLTTQQKTWTVTITTETSSPYKDVNGNILTAQFTVYQAANKRTSGWYTIIDSFAVNDIPASGGSVSKGHGSYHEELWYLYDSGDHTVNSTLSTVTFDESSTNSNLSYSTAVSGSQLTTTTSRTNKGTLTLTVTISGNKNIPTKSATVYQEACVVEYTEIEEDIIAYTAYPTIPTEVTSGNVTNGIYPMEALKIYKDRTNITLNSEYVINGPWSAQKQTSYTPIITCDGIVVTSVIPASGGCFVTWGTNTSGSDKNGWVKTYDPYNNLLNTLNIVMHSTGWDDNTYNKIYCDQITFNIKAPVYSSQSSNRFLLKDVSSNIIEDNSMHFTLTYNGYNIIHTAINSDFIGVYDATSGTVSSITTPCYSYVTSNISGTWGTYIDIYFYEDLSQAKYLEDYTWATEYQEVLSGVIDSMSITATIGGQIVPQEKISCDYTTNRIRITTNGKSGDVHLNVTVTKSYDY